MWILTQNGERILSTEALDEIRVAEPLPGKTDFVVMIKRRIDGKEFALGFYRRKNKATSILKDIIKEQAAWTKVDGTPDAKMGMYQPAYAIIPPKTYMMPGDDENYGM